METYQVSKHGAGISTRARCGSQRPAGRLSSRVRSAQHRVRGGAWAGSAGARRAPRAPAALAGGRPGVLVPACGARSTASAARPGPDLRGRGGRSERRPVLYGLMRADGNTPDRFVTPRVDLRLPERKPARPPGGAGREVGLSYYATRTAVITGAGSGIGRALATGLARRGAQLALSDRDADAVADTAQQCQLAGGRVRTDTVDVTDRQAVLDYSAAVLGDFGGVDLVFCVAGVIHTGSLLASEFAAIDHVINVNQIGVINTAKAFLPHLISSGGGHIVTFSSGFGLMAAPHYSAYNASKFAVRG